MKITWNDYEKYDDGSQSGSCYATVEIKNATYVDEIHIIDHTCPQQRESDIGVRRTVHYAYDVYMGRFAYDFHLDENPDFDTHPHQFVREPDHTIDDVKRMVEDKIIEKYTFNYEERLSRVMIELLEQKALMEEVLQYKNERDKEN